MRLLISLSFICALLLGGLTWYAMNLHAAPSEFSPITITIPSGTPVGEIARLLESQNVIRSQELFQITLHLREEGHLIQAGTYTFSEPTTLSGVINTLISGDSDQQLRSLTFREGETIATYATIAASLPEITPQEWIQTTSDLEGTLFPETYFVPPDFSTTELIELLQTEHASVMSELHTLYDTEFTDQEIITLASIIEREANTPESMRLVAGIFQNRLQIGMPLQADASIEYVLETPLGELPPGQLASELRNLNSPYNTYRNQGLPPTPIGNPGRQALEAVFNPLPSEYLYYITGTDGEFYYAETYNQHLTNIERYLR